MRRKAFRGAAQRQEQRMQPIAGEQERRRKQQRENRDELTGQKARLTPSVACTYPPTAPSRNA
jgi:hypothetical protein